MKKNKFDTGYPASKGKFIIGCCIVVVLFGCESLVDVDMPSTNYVERKAVFADEATAEAAAIGMYGQMRSSSHPFYGNSTGLSDLTGLAADELFYPHTDIRRIQFMDNDLLADNSIIETTWSRLYASIYTANMLIENLEGSEALPEALKNQLSGEAFFVRAFCYFYMVNLFGEVPLVTTTDYRINANIPRSPLADVYDQIEADLVEARELLSVDYPDGERVRPNVAVATALLARVHLYRENWETAEDMASELIDNPDYDMVDINSITLANNMEAIWQFSSANSSLVNPPAAEGANFAGSSSVNVLQSDFTDAFEPGDDRMTEWVRTNASTENVPDKYKVSAPGGGRSEYSTVFRLAEQYLIRAEARARQGGDLTDAIADLDAIRDRAGLPLLADTNPGINQADLLDAIMQERQVELFTEWGHRWLDLKRTGRAVGVLSPIKPGFTVEDELWPIPQLEINNNPALRGHQNAGY